MPPPALENRPFRALIGDDGGWYSLNKALFLGGWANFRPFLIFADWNTWLIVIKLIQLPQEGVEKMDTLPETHIAPENGWLED